MLFALRPVSCGGLLRSRAVRPPILAPCFPYPAVKSELSGELLRKTQHPATWTRSSRHFGDFAKSHGRTFTPSLKTDLMAAQLQPLPNIARLSDNVVRVLGQNPGKFTLQGTNTYIIGTSNPYTLIDTGEGRPDYIPILKSALTTTALPSNPSLPDISDIILSHWHHDHVDGLPTVLALLKQLFEERNPGQKYNPPRLHKFPYDHSAAGRHSGGAPWTVPEIVAKLPLDSYLPSPKGDPFHELHDNQILLHAGLRILHTPGHTADSVCIHVHQDKALYTADTVLGEGTAVFEDLGEYLDSLQKILDFDNSGETAYTAVYPGHGPVVKDGKSLIKTYIQHRLDRESQILKVLSAAPPTTKGEDTPSNDLSVAKNWTTWSLVSVIYAAYPESLWPAAANSVELHLRKLERDGVVRKVGGEIPRTEWEVLGDKVVEQIPVDRLSSL